MLGRGFTHYPANRINDIRLATAIWADDTDETAGDVDSGRVDEGLEPGQLYFGQLHGRLGYSIDS